MRGKPCRARSSEQKVKSEKSGNTFYPRRSDFLSARRVSQGKGDHTSADANGDFRGAYRPQLRRYDRTDKFKDYLPANRGFDRLPFSLRPTAYLRIEHFHLHSPMVGSWQTLYSRRDRTLESFPDLEIDLPLAEIYDELDLPDALQLSVCNRPRAKTIKRAAGASVRSTASVNRGARYLTYGGRITLNASGACHDQMAARIEGRPLNFMVAGVIWMLPIREIQKCIRVRDSPDRNIAASSLDC